MDSSQTHLTTISFNIASASYFLLLKGMDSTFSNNGLRSSGAEAMKFEKGT